MVDFHVRQDAVFFKNPVNLLLLAPNDVPVIVPTLLPLPVNKTVVYAVLESGFELYVGAR